MEPVTLGAASGRNHWLADDHFLLKHWVQRASAAEWATALTVWVGADRRLKMLLAARVVRRAAAQVPAARPGSAQEAAAAFAAAAAVGLEGWADGVGRHDNQLANLRDEVGLLLGRLRRASKYTDRAADAAVAVASAAVLAYPELDAWRAFARDEHAAGDRLVEVRTAHAAFVQAVAMPGRDWDPSWSTSHVTSLAHAMYDGRDFSAGPILADALQEAGCDDGVMLDRLRDGSWAFPGCWVVDNLLKKR